MFFKSLQIYCLPAPWAMTAAARVALALILLLVLATLAALTLR